MRLPDAEALLRSATPTDSEVRFAAEEAAGKLPIAADRRASEEYRRHLVTTLLERSVRSVVAVADGGR